MRHTLRKWLPLCPIVLAFAISSSWSEGRLLAQDKSCGDVQNMARNSANARCGVIATCACLVGGGPAAMPPAGGVSALGRDLQPSTSSAARATKVNDRSGWE